MERKVEGEGNRIVVTLRVRRASSKGIWGLEYGRGGAGL